MTTDQTGADFDVFLDPGALTRQMAVDVRVGLTSDPKVLAPKYFYDGRGSGLFDQITRVPEYYPTRTEAAILERYADEIASVSGAETLVELGSGTSEKTRRLLRALSDAGTLKRFVPFDVDPVILQEASVSIARDFPGIEMAPAVGDFEKHLRRLPHHPRSMVAFLGSTMGNMDPAQRADFLAGLRAILEPGDSFLLGVDLVKPVDRLEAAYDDAQGVTAAFNKNVLSVMNASLGADFDPEGFDHRALWVPEHERVEMRLVSARDQRVRLSELDLEVSFAQGEEMRTEISSKFRRATLQDELSTAGLDLAHWWTDDDEDFVVLLATPM